MLLRAVILGAPASGKGTISSRIVRHFDIVHVSSGDLIRSEIARNSAIGQEAGKYTFEGKLVPNNLIVNLVFNKLTALSTQSWLLDGFPRTRRQAESLNEQHPVNIALLLNVPVDVIVARVQNRWIHEASGRVYNTDFNRPQIWGYDDITGEPLVQRPDDRPDAVRERLRIFRETVRPVCKWYAQHGVLRTICGDTSDEIWPHVYRYLDQILPAKVPLSI